MKLPSSRVSLRISFSLFDGVWALATPYIALVIRDAQVLSFSDPKQQIVFQIVCFGCSLFTFLIFRLHEGVTRYFSVTDAVQIAKAVFLAELLSSTVIFLFTRLEGIPRSTLIVHALLLGAGLVGARMLTRLVLGEALRPRPTQISSECIVMIGSTPLNTDYLKLLNDYGAHRVIGFLDSRPRWVGRSVSGIRILGLPQDLGRVVDEFGVHGLHTDRVIIGGDEGYLSTDEIKEVRRICTEREIILDFVPHLAGLDRKFGPTPAPFVEPLPTTNEPSIGGDQPAIPSTYFIAKRSIDVVAAMTLVILLAPVFVVVGCLVLIDVGPPVLFWQQRIGRAGRTFLLQKFRTLRPPFDWAGQTISERHRLSWIGRMLRRIRLDELPQLLNVLVGDMSLIGPRPLLPQDQPPNPEIRLTVRPGITGWAQVNGGNLITPKEKHALDEWYIRNASLRLDLRIIALTLRFAVIGEHRMEDVITKALNFQKSQQGPRSGAAS